MRDNKKLPKFRDFTKDGVKAINKKRRAEKFSWSAGDLEITHNKPDTRDKFSWGHKDVVVKESAYADGFDDQKNESFVDRQKELREKHLQDHKPSEEELQHHKAHQESLSPEHHRAIDHYKGIGYKHINNSLRRGSSEDDKPRQHIKELDHVTNHKTKHDMHLYRGFGGGVHEGVEPFFFKSLKAGDTFKDHGYTSTSQSHGIASGFAASSPPPEIGPDGKKHAHRYIAKIHAPAGTRLHYLDNEAAHHHTNREEREVLLHRGTTFKVDKVAHHDLGENGFGTRFHQHIIHLSVHHQEDHK